MGSKKSATMLVSTGGGSRSLRTTIPMWIVEHFNLSAGDSVRWKFKVDEGQIIVVMTPASNQTGV
jgi:antitoxin component of MazEF toxin-antitoxin module|tara:strand:+ start:5879 stop:6073 length:195 start_codon:yes stop_codon:yes gene_type:complete